MEINLAIKPSGELAPSELEQLDDWLPQALGVDAYQWSGFRWRALVWAGGQIVGHVGITERAVTVGGAPLRLGGVGAITTRPGWRRRGLATAALQEALAFLCETRGVPFILLVCSEDLIPLYRRLGWEVVDGPLSFDQHSGQVVWPDTIMVRPCAGTPWPLGAIDLGGLPW